MRKRHIKFVSIVMVVFLANMNMVFASPKEIDKYSKTSILIDQETSRVLYEKNPDQKVALASLSKMMTFLLAIEAIENKEISGEDIVEIDQESAKVRGSSYKLKEGEKVEVKHLMRGLMIVSGNDAAVALSKHICGTQEKFVRRMNKKAAEIGMINTSFVNPHGLPIYSLENPQSPPKENLSTARDISILGKYLFDNYEKQTVEITNMQRYSYPERGFDKGNTNPLLSMIENVDGIKTGYTGNAGYCLAFSMMIPQDNNNIKAHRVIGVVLGANHKQKRLQSAMSLLRFAENEFGLIKVMNKDTAMGKKYIQGVKELEVELEVLDEQYVVLGINEILHSQTTIKELTYPIEKGDIIGEIKYFTEDGDILGQVNIVANNKIGNPSLITKIKILLKD